MTRSYISPETKAVVHPVRAQILKALKEGDKSTIELEAITGETRYNLYHHLNALEQVGLLGWTMRDNKTKLYHAKTADNPEVAVIMLAEEDVKAKKEQIEKLVEILGVLNDNKLPAADKITSAEFCLHYKREDEKKG